jgi:hypothetical protein
MSKLQDFFQAAHQPTFVPEISSTISSETELGPNFFIMSAPKYEWVVSLPCSCFVFLLDPELHWICAKVNYQQILVNNGSLIMAPLITFMEQ